MMQLQPGPLLLANRVYGLLLRAYPAPFRQEYGRDMAQLFRDATRATQKEKGATGLAGLWLLTFLDLVKSAVTEHIDERFKAPSMGFTRWKGLAAILGAALFYGGTSLGAFFFYENRSLSPAVYIAILGAVALSLPLLALALFGLYRQLPQRTAAGLPFVIAEVGLLLYVVGILVLFTTNRVDEAMTMISAGSVLLGLGSFGLGVIGLFGGSPGWWSIGPLLLGAGQLLFTITAVEEVGLIHVLLAIGVLLIGWFLTGLSLWIGPTANRRPGLPA